MDMTNDRKKDELSEYQREKFSMLDAADSETEMTASIDKLIKDVSVRKL